MLGVLVLLISFAGMGCNNTPGKSGNSGTTSGAYTVTVTGASGSLSQTTSINLTVQ
jgi:hypothetical protein